MFSLLYYLSILPYPLPIVKHYFHIFCEINFSLSLCYTALSNMSFRGGAKPRRGNLPVQCLFLRYFSIDCTRRLPRRMASSRHAPRNDKLDTFCTLHSVFCISSVSSININLNFPYFRRISFKRTGNNLSDDGARRAGESRKNLNGNPMLPGQFHAAIMENLGAVSDEFQHFFVR